MGFMKDQWIAEYERIGDEYAGGDIPRGIAEERLKDLGLDMLEIKEALDEAKA